MSANDYAETIALIERLHRRFLDVLRAELERHGIDEVNNVQGLLLANIDAFPPPLPLLSQHLPEAYRAVREGRISPRSRDLVRHSIRQVVETYSRACHGIPEPPSPGGPTTL